MNKAETKIPFQYCNLCNNHRSGGKGLPAHKGKFTQLGRDQYTWTCDTCLEKSHLADPKSYAENVLEDVFRQYKIRFRTQFRLGNYIYDFQLPEHRVFVEVDGRKAHSRNKQYRDNLKNHAVDQENKRIEEEFRAKKKDSKGRHWRLVRIRPVGAWVDRLLGFIKQRYRNDGSYRNGKPKAQHCSTRRSRSRKRRGKKVSAT